MGRYPRPVNQYSQDYHLSRPVCCVGCGVRLHKTYDFVLHGSCCDSCWSEVVVSRQVVNMVYVWKEEASEGAEVVMETVVVDPDEAIKLVMGACGLTSAYYVWVVPIDEWVACTGRSLVCLSV